MDSYRPTYWGSSDPPPPPPDARTAMYHFKGNREGNTRNFAPIRSHRPFTFRPSKAYERPLLTTSRQSPDATTFPNVNAQEKFRDLDNLTESDETDMDFSDSEDPDDQPSKRVRVDNSDRSPPKWSNPDPYTALPPVDESSRKKKDVVKLIRKARNTTSSATVTDANDDDFISFDMDDDWFDPNMAPPDAPSGPRLDRQSNGRINANIVDSDSEYGNKPNPVLGKRKRVEHVPGAGRRIPIPVGGAILEAYQIIQDCDPSPWLKPGADPKDHPGIALHKEIIDFYEWVKPQDFETTIRADLVTRLKNAFNRLEPGELKAFGSYAAGLYLPTGDMDLVYVQRSTRRGPKVIDGRPAKLPMSHFRKYSTFLASQEISKPGSIQIVGHAKVQIIKFVDRISGLKVDLCFNNDSGLIANETFRSWKAAYPAMPIIVSVIKQFLMMRGLNDVSLGGLGGFSTICLVTSFIQHMPFSGQPPNLGQCLFEFFNLYGNLFNRHDVAIRLDPPGYIDKASYAPHLFNRDQPGRLTIIDPNRPENNISGGTNKIETIFRCFAHAHEKLSGFMSDYAENPASVRSFLASIIGGNFSSYEKQRAQLRKLRYGPDVVTPPSPTSSARATVPPPPPNLTGSVRQHRLLEHEYYSRTSARQTKEAWKKEAAERKAARLRTTRPELADRIHGSISVTEAVISGGYSGGQEMGDDLTRISQASAARRMLKQAGGFSGQEILPSLTT